MKNKPRPKFITTTILQSAPLIVNTFQVSIYSSRGFARHYFTSIQVTQCPNKKTVYKSRCSYLWRKQLFLKQVSPQSKLILRHLTSTSSPFIRYSSGQKSHNKHGKAYYKFITSQKLQLVPNQRELNAQK